MKLRNKKTGKIINGGDTFVLADYAENEMSIREQYEYITLSELNKEWEDYEPKQPLIEDKKVRKAVRAWAEAIDNKEDLVVAKNMEYHECCIYDGNHTGALIDLGIDLDIDENTYSLTELCGEED